MTSHGPLVTGALSSVLSAPRTAVREASYTEADANASDNNQKTEMGYFEIVLWSAFVSLTGCSQHRVTALTWAKKAGNKNECHFLSLQVSRRKRNDDDFYRPVPASTPQSAALTQ